MKRIAKWVGIVLAVLILIVVSLPFLINVDQFRPTLQSDLSDALGREVTLGNLQLKILAGEVTADDLSVAEDPAFGKPAFLQAKSLHVGVEIWPFLISRKLIVTDLIIDQPEIALVQSPSGDWNFSSLGAASPRRPPAASPTSGRLPLDLSVQLVKISNGRLTLSRTVGPLETTRAGAGEYRAARFFRYLRVSFFTLRAGAWRRHNQAGRKSGPDQSHGFGHDAGQRQPQGGAARSRRLRHERRGARCHGPGLV